MEWNRMGWNEMQWDGIEWDGMEWDGIKWDGIEYKTLFNHGNSIKFNVINMEKLFYLKATRRTNLSLQKSTCY